MSLGQPSLPNTKQIPALIQGWWPAAGTHMSMQGMRRSAGCSVCTHAWPAMAPIAARRARVEGRGLVSRGKCRRARQQQSITVAANTAAEPEIGRAHV